MGDWIDDLKLLVFGSEYTATVRFDYNDKDGKDSLWTVVNLRARYRIKAAAKALCIAQRNFCVKWKCITIEELILSKEVRRRTSQVRA